MKSDVSDTSTSSGQAGRFRSAARFSAGFGFAVLDQGVFTGASFIFTVLLTRWMTAVDFGAFSVAYVIMILYQNLFEGLVYEPFGIFGAGQLSQRLQAYTGRALIAISAIGAAFAAVTAVLAAASHVLGQDPLANAFLGLAVAVPFLLFRLFVRQPLYILSRIQWSVGSSLVYFILNLAVLYLLATYDMLTPFSAFAAMSISAVISSGIIVCLVLRPTWRSVDSMLEPRMLIAAHLSYGKWAFGERILSWAQGALLILGLPIFAGLHASAAYRAVTTLVLPASMSMSAAWNFLLPVLVRENAAQKKGLFRGGILLPIAVTATSAYGLVLISSGPEIGHFLYSGRYDEDLTLTFLTAVAAGLLFAAVSGIFELKLRTLLEVRTILLARVAATAVLLIVGVPLVVWFHLAGAAIASALAGLTTVLVECRIVGTRSLWSAIVA
jgi:O-antigen/teichoic acid export membrane protein